MFRIGKLEIEQFDSKKLKKALNWFNFTIDLIYFDTEFIKMKNQFYCENLCSVRDVCKKGE